MSDQSVIAGKRILITGGAGFIGASMVEQLIENNSIVVYDSLHRNALKYTNFLDHPNMTFIEGDVMDLDNVRKAVRDCNMIIHLAAIAGVDTIISMPIKTMEVAIIGTYNILKAAIEEKNIERFIDFSTSEVFGSFAYNVQEGDATTLGSVGEARWTYAVSKLATEHLVLSHYKQNGFPALSIRPFNIFGPRQVGLGAIHTFIERALNNKPLYINNGGSQIRSWCYIDDIVEGICLSLKKEKAVGQAFNIGNPRNTLTIYNLAKMIKRLCGSKSEILIVNKKIADIELRIPNIDKAKSVLGYEPCVDLEEGLIKTIKWYRDNM